MNIDKLIKTRFEKIVILILSAIVLCSYPFIIFFLASYSLCNVALYILRHFYIKQCNSEYTRRIYEIITDALIFVCLFILLTKESSSYPLASIFTFFMIFCLLYCFVRDVIHIACSFFEFNSPKRIVFLRYAIPLFIIYMILGGSIPYLNQPDVNNSFKKSFSADNFYSDKVSCDRATIIEDNGDALSERIRMIENAKESIILTTFDFCADTSGKQIISALMAASDRGVQVKVLLDGFNFWTHVEGNPYFYALMAKSNVKIRVYNIANPLIPWKGMSRMHDKYIIADTNIYMLGGRNTFNYFLGSGKGHKNLDRDVLIYNTGSEDSSVYLLLEYFNNIWELDCCKTWKYTDYVTNLPAVTNASKELTEIYKNMKKDHREWFVYCDYSLMTVPTNKVSLLSNPTHLYSKEPLVFWQLCKLMENASDNVTIHTPYIICNDMMYDSFRRICNKVDVTLMTNSPANNGNAFGAVDLILHKQDILDTGLNVIEYNGGISYHGKSLTIDDRLSVVGSFNMDMKSAYQDTELMLVIDSPQLNTMLTEIFAAYHADSTPSTLINDEFDLLCQEKPKKKNLFFLIRLLDPILRFLM